MITFTTAQIAERLGARLQGNDRVTITGLNTVDDARPGDLTFIGHARFADGWSQSQAAAALTSAEIAPLLAEDRPLLIVDHVDLAMASMLEAFAPAWPKPDPAIHPAAVIDASASLDNEVCVGANAVIGPRVTIGARSIIHPGVVLMDDVQIGTDCVIFPGTVIRERCQLGDHCILHPNVTIGADGFGYRPAADGSGLVKIPQIGTVQIGSHVEIGSGTCIDRGKFAETIIGDGTKIDNLCQIGHNCRVGRSCIIVGAVSIAGSVIIGDGVIIGGGSNLRDHIKIGDGAILTASSNVINDVAPGQTVGGYPAGDMGQMKRAYALLPKLPELFKKIRRLEKASDQ